MKLRKRHRVRIASGVRGSEFSCCDGPKSGVVPPGKVSIVRGAGHSEQPPFEPDIYFSTRSLR